MRSKELRAQRAKLIEDARALIAADEVTDEDTARFDGMMAESDGLLARAEKLERADAMVAQNAEAMRAAGERRGLSADEMAERVHLEDDTFKNWLRFGTAGLNDDQRPVALRRIQQVQAAQSAGTPSAGGYTVPQGFYDALTEARKAYGGMAAVSTIIQTDTGATLPVPTTNDTSNVGALLTENTQVSGQDVTFGSVSLGAWTYTSKLILVSNQLLQDSAFDLNGFLARVMGTRIARIINTHFTTGDGSSKPTGITASPTVAKTGTTGQTLSVITDDLFDLLHGVDPAYRTNGRFMLADSSLKVIKKLKDSQGRPLWLPGIAMKEPDTINGFPYVINQDMPVMAANALSIAFGDFSNYFVREVVGTQVLRLTERYADYNQTGFLAFQRWDGNVIDAGMHPIQFYKNSAT